MTIYREGIVEGNNLAKDEYIRILQNNKKNNEQLSFDEYKEFTEVKFFKNIDDIVDYATNIKNYHRNTYFNLATTDGVAGTNENLINRYFLAFDFDKKDFEKGFNHKDILNLFSKIKLHYHILVDSGNGYHAYVLINKTSDIKLVSEVTNALIEQLRADENANLTTQVLRVPYTWNIKDKPKKVKIIHQDEKIHRYDIEKLAKRFCRDVKVKSDRNINYVLNTNIPECIAKILKNGSEEGKRNSDLQKIVVSLRLRNKTEAQVLAIAREWNDKSENGFNDRELEYQTNNMYEKLKGVDFGCGGCDLSSDCWNRIESDFIYNSDEDTLLNTPHKHMKDLKYKNRKGAKIMNGNQLFIYNVLLNNEGRELNVNEILELITYRRKKKVKNVVMSEKTLRDTLKELLENDYITKKKGNTRAGIPDTYKINTVRCKVDKEFTISYFVNLAVIWGIIGTEELRLYTHMRYKQDLMVKEGKAKGNILRINQEELAKDLGMTQQNVSILIDDLLETKILDIWETKVNDNGFMYYTYRLNK